MNTGKAEIVKWSIRKVQRMILNCSYIVTSLTTTWHKITISDANIFALKKAPCLQIILEHFTITF